MSRNLDVGPFGGGNTAVFQDVQASGVAAQNIGTVNTTYTLRFNTEIVPKSWASLASDQITLDSGIYAITFISDLRSSNFAYSQLQIYDTVGAAIIGGCKRQSSGTSDMFQTTEMKCFINLSSQTTLELRYRTSQQEASNLMVAHSQGDEYYHQVYITKVG